MRDRPEPGLAETVSAAADGQGPERPVGTEPTLRAEGSPRAGASTLEDRGTAHDADGASTGGSARRSVFARVEGERYARRGELARGGMGRIVVAHDQALDRTVALKELLVLDAVAFARFEREARITARLQHPSIVPLYEAGQGPDGTPFFAMKKVEGRSLDEALGLSRSLDERLRCLPNVLAVAEAMAYAHANGVIHRDLKPLNVLVGRFGETVVIDWGIARDLRSDDALDARAAALRVERSDDDKVTVDGTVIGTPAYMAPEQAGGEALDERADVYALGAILYETLTGRPPFAGASGWYLLARVLREAPEPVDALAPEAPRALVAIVTRAMQRERDARYANAGAFAEDLRRFLDGQLVAAHRYSSRELLARWARRNRGALLTGAVFALLLVLVGALSLSRVLRARDVALRAAAEAERARREAVAAAHRAVLARAREALERDPARAVALLRALDLEGPGWGTARVIALDAYARGIPIVARSLGISPAGVPIWSDDSARVAIATDDGRVALFSARDPHAPVEIDGPELRARPLGRIAFRRRDHALLAQAPGASSRIYARTGPGAWALEPDDEATRPLAAQTLDPSAALRIVDGVFSRFDERQHAWQSLRAGVSARVALASPDEDYALLLHGLDDARGVQRLERVPLAPGAISPLRAPEPIREYPRGAAELSAGGRWITVDRARIFSADTGEELRAGAGSVASSWVAVAPDGRAFAASGADESHFVVVRVGPDGVLVEQTYAGAARRGSVLTRGGARLISPAPRGVMLFDLERDGPEAPTRMLVGHAVEQPVRLAVSPDERLVVTVGSEGGARVWSLDAPSTGAHAQRLDRAVLAVDARAREHSRGALTLDDDGVHLALSRLDDDGQLRRVAPLEHAAEAARALDPRLWGAQAFDVAGAHAMVVSVSDGARFYDAQQGRLVASVPGARRAVFSLDARHAVALDARGLVLVSLDGGAMRRVDAPVLPRLDGGTGGDCATPAVVGLLSARDAAALVGLACRGSGLRWMLLSSDGARWRPLAAASPLPAVATQTRAVTLVTHPARALVAQLDVTVAAARTAPSGDALGFVTADGSIVITSLSSGETHVAATSSVELEPLGFDRASRLFFVAAPSALFVLEVRTGRLRSFARAPGPLRAWAVDDASRALLWVTPQQATLLDLAQGDARTLPATGRAHEALDAWFSQDGLAAYWAAGAGRGYADELRSQRDELANDPASIRRWIVSQRLRLDEVTPASPSTPESE